MKLFLSRLLLFLLPFLVGICFLMLTALDKSFAYHYVKNDCGGHAAWLYERIFENPGPVDIAFIGSSRTIHGPIDTLLEDLLLKKTGLRRKIATLGYCRLGRNMSYLLLKDLLREKKPQVVVLEVGEDEDRYSHPMFPYLADGGDVFRPVVLFNRDLASDYYLALETRFEYVKRKLLQPSSLNNAPRSKRISGYGSAPTVADTGLLAQKKAERERRAARKLAGKGRAFHLRYPRAYLKKIAALAEAHQIRLYFLYLPEYGWPLPGPMELPTYRQYGETWLPPAKILEEKSHWLDDGHLNDRGAEALSVWLSEKDF